MASNLTVEAAFVTNFFRPLSGTYAGLFYNSTNLTPQTAGMVSGVVVGVHGGVSGRLLLGGGSYSFGGVFNGAGAASLVARATNGAGFLNLQLTLSAEAADLTGIVSETNEPSWSANLVAARASTSRGSGQYTMLVPPDADDPAGPPGYGWAVVTKHDGVATFSGTLADGAGFSETALILANGVFPLYASLDLGSGLLMGWLDFSTVPQGTIWRIKEASPIGALYREGFTNMVSALSSAWTNLSPGQPAVASTNGLIISEGGLAAPLVFTVEINDKNELVKISGATNSLSGAVNPTNGVLRITFGNGVGKATTKGVGVLLQTSNFAGGSFLGATNAGEIILTNAGAVILP
jgi:hypothetical protein